MKQDANAGAYYKARLDPRLLFNSGSCADMPGCTPAREEFIQQVAVCVLRKSDFVCLSPSLSHQLTFQGKAVQ